MLKVMLIDDEIMALNHMETLVDWNTLGFEIVALKTNGAKGLDFLRKEDVDVIFVDIRMPGMDGLEFSEKALEINQQLEIIILTSYGDFDYAKRSLNIGISNYLLKHEIKEKELIQELEEIREKLVNTKQNDKVILGQLLYKYILFPKQVSDQEKKRIVKYLRCDKMNMISYLVVLDIPYQLLNDEEQYNAVGFRKETIGRYIELNYNNMTTIHIKDGYWLVLNVFKPIISQKQILDETYMAAYGLQRHIYQRYQKTVSIIPSAGFNNIEELPDIYNNLKRISKHLIFYGKNKILYGRDIITKVEMEQDQVDKILRHIQKGLMEEDIKIVLKKTDMFFGICVRNLDQKAFRYFCNQLMKILLYYIKEYKMDEIYEKLAAEANIFFSVFEIHEWFPLQFERVINEIKKEEFKDYSPAIREAMQYIKNNYFKDIKVDDVAEHMNISGDYFRHLFKEEVGEGFVEYLTEVRINKSKELLLENKYKLYEIANLVGYNSGAYFSSVFKKYTGIRPQDYQGDQNER